MTDTRVGPFWVYVAPDYDPCISFDDQDFPATFGVDLSNHRDYASPTYGEEAPVLFRHYMDYRANPGHLDGVDNWQCIQFHNQYYVLPVYMYDHGVRTVSTNPYSCRWDSGLAGFVYIKKSVVWEEGLYGCKKSWNAKRREECGRKYLSAMIKELGFYMTGQVYYYRVVYDGDIIDSCSGFVGEEDHALEEGAEAAKGILMDYRQRRLGRIKQLIKHRTPLHLRDQLLSVYPSHLYS